jgi:hypothetical protein
MYFWKINYVHPELWCFACENEHCEDGGHHLEFKSEVILIQSLLLFLCDCERYYVFPKNYVYSKLWCFACEKEHHDIRHHHISYPTTFSTWTLCLIHDVCLLNIDQCLIKLWQVKVNELLLLNKQ